MFGKRRELPQEAPQGSIDDDPDLAPFSIIHGVKPTPDDLLDFYEDYREESGDAFEPMESKYQTRLAARGPQSNEPVDDDTADIEPFSIIHGVKPTPDDVLDFYERYREMSGGDTFEPMESKYQTRLAARAVAQSGVSLDLPGTT